MRRLPGLILIALLMLAGCGGEPAGQADEAPQNADRPASEEAGQVDEGDSGGSGGGSLALPGLPIGGDPVEFTEADTECVVVSWTGDQLPDTAAVRIENFTVPDQFTVESDPCGDEPPCLSDDGWLSADDGPCTVAVSWSGEQPSAEQPWTLQATSGTVTCDVLEECERSRWLASNAGPQTIELTISATG